jgi:8-hydroxy-5-deazaflavin:NADPH oxidoreductase
MNIAFIGSGQVGSALAVHLAEAGHNIILAESKEGSATLAATLERSSRISSRPVGDALRAAEVVFVAIPFGAVDLVLRPIADALQGKILVDCTNPVGPGLSHGLRSERSGSEFIASVVPGARVVKAFTIYGFENLENPSYPGHSVKPAMFFAGNDKTAKEVVGELIRECGFEPLDVGGLEQALHLEHMTLLWVRMVRAGGHSPNLVWGALTR